MGSSFVSLLTFNVELLVCEKIHLGRALLLHAQASVVHMHGMHVCIMLHKCHCIHANNYMHGPNGTGLQVHCLYVDIYCSLCSRTYEIHGVHVGNILRQH